MAGMVATAASARADSFVSGFEGSVNLTPTTGSGVMGSINVSFAVVNTTNGAGNYLNTITGSTSYTGVTGQYVYLYEITNLSNRNVGTLQLNSMNPALLLNQGAVAGYAFQNQPLASGPAQVVSQNPPNTNGGATAFAPTSANNAGNSFGTASNLVPFSSADNQFGATTGFNFRDSNGNDNLGGSLTGDPSHPYYYSELVYFTSNNAPTYGPGQVSDGATFGPEGMPVASPEPTSMAMMGLGVFGMGGWAGWRRRFRKTSDLS